MRSLVLLKVPMAMQMQILCSKNLSGLYSLLRSNLLRSTNLETALVALNVLATHSLLTFPFVDDVSIFYSTVEHPPCALEQF